MTTFYLLRHGVKETVQGDPPLSELGVKQAEVTAKFLKDFSIKAIYASPLHRTFQTAQVCANVLGLQIVTDDRLKERMNWGDKDGETFEEFLEEWEKASRDRHYKPAHGNSSFDTGERFTDFLLEVGKKSLGKEILVVTHGGAIGDFLLNTFTDLTLTSSSKGATYVKILECSITTVNLENKNFTLKDVGSVNHLSEPLI